MRAVRTPAVDGHALAVSEPAREFVGVPTPQAWLDAAVSDLPTLLIDHANCERKAAATALALIARYPAEVDLLPSLSRLAREEMRHFEQVLAVLAKRGWSMRALTASRYAGRLMADVRSQGTMRLIDTLLVAAIVEARSCERFAALVTVLPAELASFYAKLLASEARHFEMYLGHARRVASATTGASSDNGASIGLDERLKSLIALDNELIESPDVELRFHSGPPA